MTFRRHTGLITQIRNKKHFQTAIIFKQQSAVIISTHKVLCTFCAHTTFDGFPRGIPSVLWKCNGGNPKRPLWPALIEGNEADKTTYLLSMPAYEYTDPLTVPSDIIISPLAWSDWLYCTHLASGGEHNYTAVFSLGKTGSALFNLTLLNLFDILKAKVPKWSLDGECKI